MGKHALPAPSCRSRLLLAEQGVQVTLIKSRQFAERSVQVTLVKGRQYAVTGVKVTLVTGAITLVGLNSAPAALASSLSASSTYSASSASTQKLSCYIIGDSILRAVSGAGLKNQLMAQGYNVRINADTGRSIHGAGTDLNQTGLEAIRADRTAVGRASVIVIELGTNFGDTTGAITELITAIRAINPTAKILWVNVASMGYASKRADSIATYNAENSRLADLSGQLGFTVVDWEHVVFPDGDISTNPKPNMLGDDGVHPTHEGAKVLADLINAGVANATPEAPEPSATPTSEPSVEPSVNPTPTPAPSLSDGGYAVVPGTQTDVTDTPTADTTVPSGEPSSAPATVTLPSDSASMPDAGFAVLPGTTVTVPNTNSASPVVTDPPQPAIQADQQNQTDPHPPAVIPPVNPVVKDETGSNTSASSAPNTDPNNPDDPAVVPPPTTGSDLIDAPVVTPWELTSETTDNTTPSVPTPTPGADLIDAPVIDPSKPVTPPKADPAPAPKPAPPVDRPSTGKGHEFPTATVKPLKAAVKKIDTVYAEYDKIARHIDVPTALLVALQYRENNDHLDETIDPRNGHKITSWPYTNVDTGKTYDNYLELWDSVGKTIKHNAYGVEVTYNSKLTTDEVAKIATSWRYGSQLKDNPQSNIPHDTDYRDNSYAYNGYDADHQLGEMKIIHWKTGNTFVIKGDYDMRLGVVTVYVAVTDGIAEANDNFAPEPPGNYKHEHYSGVELNKRTLVMLKKAMKIAKKLGVRVQIDLSQGSYNPGGVKASGHTHDKGGALDIRVHGMTSQEIDDTVFALREVGFAAWHRTKDQGFDPHIHAIAIGDEELSDAALKQVADYFAGRNGLANNGPDTEANLGAQPPRWTAQFH